MIGSSPPYGNFGSVDGIPLGHYPRLTLYTDTFDWKTLGVTTLRGVPNAPSKRFLLLVGRTIVVTGSGTYTTGPTFAPGFSIGGVTQARITDALALSVALLNTKVVNLPGPSSNFAQASSTPWPLLDLSQPSVIGIPTVELTVAAAGVGTGATSGYIILDGLLV